MRLTHPFDIGQATGEKCRLDESREPLAFVPVAVPVPTNLPEAHDNWRNPSALSDIEYHPFCYPLGLGVACAERGGRVEHDFGHGRGDGAVCVERVSTGRQSSILTMTNEKEEFDARSKMPIELTSWRRGSSLYGELKASSIRLRTALRSGSNDGKVRLKFTVHAIS